MPRIRLRGCKELYQRGRNSELPEAALQVDSPGINTGCPNKVEPGRAILDQIVGRGAIGGGTGSQP